MEITSTIREFFKDQNVEVILFPSTQIRKFFEIEDFIDFFQKEHNFWIKCSDGKLNSIRLHFIEIYNQLSINDVNEASLKSAINLAKKNSTPGIYSETVGGIFLRNLYDISYIQASAAYDYIFTGTVKMVDYDSFLGIMRAYDFKDRDKISKDNVEVEKNALNELRLSYSSKLENLGSEFFSRSEQITSEFNAVQEKIKDGHEQFLNNTQSLLESSKERINELENLYREKLRLQAPAKYWEDLRDGYIKKGETWRDWSLYVSGAFILFLTVILYNSPKELFEQFGFNSVKATLVFALITSIGIYIIRIFVMLSTSAFHLARDANERHQLTHVYLSLLDLKGINDAERSIVLQSIFSRSDTGLLKGNSSPVLPGMLDQIIKNLRKP